MGRSLWPGLAVLVVLVACVVAGATTLDVSASSLLWGSLLSAMQSIMTYAVLLPLGIASVVGVVLLRRVIETRRQLEMWKVQLRTLYTVNSEGMRADHWPSVRESFWVPWALRARWDVWSERLIAQRQLMRSASHSPMLDDDALLGSIECTILGVKLKASLLRQLPGLMTGLGMLGTFGGIALGLGQLGDVGGGQGVVDGIGQVVIGLASAFWTSIFGLLLALGFGLINDQAESHLLGAGSDAQDALSTLFPSASIEQILHDQHTTLRESESTQRELLRLQQQQVLLLSNAKLASDDAQQGASPQELLDQQKQIASTLERLLSVQDRQLQLLEFVHQHEPEPPRWAELVDLHQQQLSALIAMRSDAEESRSQLQTIASDLADNLARQIQDSFAAQMGPQLDRLLQLVEQQVIHAGQVSTDSGKTFTAEMVSQLSGAVRDSFDGMNQTIDTFATRFSSTTAEISDLLTQIQVTVEAQRQVAAVSAHSAQALQEQTDHMIDRWSTRESELLSGYQTASAQFVTTFERGAQMGEAIVELSRSLHDRADTCDRLLTLSERVHQRAEDAALHLSNTIQQTSAQLDLAALSMKSVATETHLWVGDTTRAVEQFGQGLSSSLQNTLTSYDRSLSQAVRSFGTAINELEELTYTLAEHGGAPHAASNNSSVKSSVIALKR